MGYITLDTTENDESFNTSYFYNKAMNAQNERHSKFDITEMMIKPTR